MTPGNETPPAEREAWRVPVETRLPNDDLRGRERLPCHAEQDSAAEQVEQGGTLSTMKAPSRQRRTRLGLPSVAAGFIALLVGSSCGFPGPEPTPTVENPPVATMERIETTDPVVFITIDDGWWQDERIFQWLEARPTPMTMYLTEQASRTQTSPYFEGLVDAGVRLENHTMTHVDLTTVSPSVMAEEICDTNDAYADRFDVRPTSFRPPYGAFDDSVTEAARVCGIRTMVMWSAEILEGKLVRPAGPKLEAGDIVLLHFRPELVDDLDVLMGLLDALGLRAARLELYLPGGPKAPAGT